MSPYAKDTDVPVSQTRAAIEHLLAQRGCSSFQSGWDQDSQSAHVVFLMATTRIGLVLPFPKAETFRFNSAGRERTKGWRSTQRMGFPNSRARPTTSGSRTSARRASRGRRSAAPSWRS